MEHEIRQPNYGMAPKKLSIYLLGIILCVILTLIAFGSVMSGWFTKDMTLLIIYTAALIQFLVQVICFIRLHASDRRGEVNLMSIVFTIIILITIVGASLWIMWNLNYYMMH